MAAAKRRMATRKSAAKPKAASKRKQAAKRELIDTGTNKLFVRRNERGTSFEKVVDVGRSLAADRRQHSDRRVPSGQGDKGDRPQRSGRTMR
jgi:hypothetical protein